MRAHPWQDVSSVNTHCRTLPENSIRRDGGLQHTHTFTHSAIKLSVQIAIGSADTASPASLLSKNPF